MIHRITGTHAFTSNFGAALWLDVDAVGETLSKRYSTIEVMSALAELGLSDQMSLSHRRIYDQWVFVLDAPVDLLYTACSILEWAAGLVKEFELVHRVFRGRKSPMAYDFVVGHCKMEFHVLMMKMD